MNAQWLQIPKRIRELREILELPQEEIALRARVPLGDYIAMENGEKDIPISALYDIAEALNVDFTVLSTGEEPRMNSYTVVRSGNGEQFNRYAGYHYEGLADNFQHRIMKPMLVTLEAEEPDPEPIVHSGQEFNLVVEGTIDVHIGDQTVRLETGDSIYFNSAIAHSQASVGGRARFLAVITDQG
ncbi:MAG: cupin domain-containing protein [Oscillospiraceae bacterium]|jgi:transcriptional regulator with XRE-family HTH domain|nr:cupin domain-containing protein [Oscillospiraceae bacterium]